MAPKLSEELDEATLGRMVELSHSDGTKVFMQNCQRCGEDVEGTRANQALGRPPLCQVCRLLGLYPEWKGTD